MKVTEAKKRYIRWGSIVSAMTHLMVGFACFQIGFALGRSSCPTARASALSGKTEAAADLVCPDPQKQEARDLTKKLTPDNADTLFPSTIESLFVGAAVVNRTDFASAVETGVPFEPSKHGNEEVLILYNSKESMPRRHSPATSKVTHFDTAKEAIQNCKAVRVVLMAPRAKSECLAIMGQWESHHIHLFRRIPKEGANATDMTPRKSLPLRRVHRFVYGDGREAYGATVPSAKVTKNYWPYLMDFLSKRDDTLQRLKPLAKAAAGKGNVVVVMLVNWGQAGVFFNFVCAARSRGLDLSKVLMFATDQATVELAASLGVHVFDVQDSFGKMPEEAAKAYGDATFNRMMFAKVYCVQLMIELGYDVLFQDVDLVWKRNPLEYFHSSKVEDYDMLFQDDGARSKRYTPYFANSGFYYVKNNARTVYFFNVFVRMGDLILAGRSHQAAMTAIMNEHISWRGLRIKVFGVDSLEGELFPGGYHFHRKFDFMKNYINGTAQPYLFHMSWTESKDVKLLFLKQLGEWYVQPECEGKKVHVIESGEKNLDLATKCCSSEALVQCHYRDKPSKIGCPHSPFMVPGKPSFW